MKTKSAQKWCLDCGKPLSATADVTESRCARCEIEHELQNSEEEIKVTRRWGTAPSFTRRGIALLIDLALHCVVVYFVTFALLAATGAMDPTPLKDCLINEGLYSAAYRTLGKNAGSVLLGVLSMTSAFGIVAASIFEASFLRGTPGKRMMGLRVARVSGAQVRFQQALSRNIVKYVPFAFISLALPLHWSHRVSATSFGVATGLVSAAVFSYFLSAVFHMQRRTVYDRRAGTYVRTTTGMHPLAMLLCGMILVITFNRLRQNPVSVADISEGVRDAARLLKRLPKPDSAAKGWEE